MKRALFMQEGTFALKVIYRGTGEEVRKFAKRLRTDSEFVKKCDVESLSGDFVFCIPAYRVDDLGFACENYIVDSDMPIPVISDRNGECKQGEWDVNSLDEVITTTFELKRNGDIAVVAACEDDDGNGYHISASMPAGEFADYLDALAELEETDSEE